MKEFETPEIEVTHFEAEDIMTASFDGDNTGEWT